jgi:hypothetical protein
LPGFSTLPVAILTIYGPGSAPLLPQFQVAALALQMQGVLEVGLLPLGVKAVTFGAALDRLALAPDVAPAPVHVMALGAGDSPFIVTAMAEGH